MIEELGITTKDFEQLTKDILSSKDLVKTLAESPISIIKIKALFSENRDYVIYYMTSCLSEVLLENYSLNDSALINKFHEADDEIFKELITLTRHAIVELITPENSDVIKGHIDSFRYGLDTARSKKKRVNKPKLKLTMERIFSLCNEETKHYLCLAAACVLSGIPNAASANIEIAIIQIFKELKLFKAIDAILLHKGGIERAAEISQKGNKVKHAKNRLIKAHAIKLYENGNFPSVRNASQKLAPKIMDYAKNADELQNLEGAVGRFNCPFQTADTIERWIGAYKKERKS